MNKFLIEDIIDSLDIQWHYPPHFPAVGSFILAELLGNKLCKYLKMEVMEGEEFRSVNKWSYLNEKNIKESF
jgi:hypothetical protein